MFIVNEFRFKAIWYNIIYCVLAPNYKILKKKNTQNPRFECKWSQQGSTVMVVRRIP